MIFYFPFILHELSFRRLRNLPLLCPFSLAAGMKMSLEVDFLLGEGKSKQPCIAMELLTCNGMNFVLDYVINL